MLMSYIECTLDIPNVCVLFNKYDTNSRKLFFLNFQKQLMYLVDVELVCAPFADIVNQADVMRNRSNLKTFLFSQ